MQRKPEEVRGDKGATVGAIRSIFGVDAVLLPCAEKTPREECGRKLAGWQKLTPAVMDNSAWLAELSRKPQIGILCRDGLIAVDLDDADTVNRWLAVHGDLRTTAVSGRQGRVKYFFRLPAGTEGKRRNLYADEAHVGELLSTGSQAIVAGLHHETGEPYRFIDQSPPRQVTMEDLVGMLSKAGLRVTRNRTKKCSVESRRQESRVQGVAVQPTGVASGERENSTLSLLRELNEAAVGAAEKALAIMEQEARTASRLAAYPENLSELYRTHVVNNWPARAGERNSFIVEAIPTLIRRVSPPVAISLAVIWYEVNRELFEDPVERHRYEAEEHCRNSLSTYRLNLSAIEGKMYDFYDEEIQAAFRIFRDLARTPSRVAPPQFVMSEPQLALRLDIEPGPARRMLERMERLGFIEMAVKGRPHRQNSKGAATIWRWLMSLEPWPQAQ